MDIKTLNAYSKKAEAYSDDWLKQQPSTDMYELWKKYLIASGSSADIGCGNGRDCKWLFDQGYSVTGFDSSPELINIAQREFPDIDFRIAALPALKEIDDKFDNIVCETVIMHLERSEVPKAINALKNLLKPGGVLYLSWRVTLGEDQRHEDDRLYSAFEPSLVLQHVPTPYLHFEDKISRSSQKRVCRLIHQALT